MLRKIILLLNFLLPIQIILNLFVPNKFVSDQIINTTEKTKQLINQDCNQLDSNEINQYSGEIGDYFGVRTLFEDLQQKKEALGIFWITEDAIEWSLGTNFAVNFFHHLTSVWENGVFEDREEFDTVISNLLLNWDNDEFARSPLGVTPIVNEIFHLVRDSFFDQVFQGTLNDIFSHQFFNSSLIEWPAVHFKVPYWFNPITSRLTLNFHNIDFQKYTNQLDVEISWELSSSKFKGDTMLEAGNLLDLLIKKIRVFIFTTTIRYNKYHKLFYFSQEDYANKSLFASKVIFIFNKIVKLKFPGSKFRILFSQNLNKTNEFFDYSYKLKFKITLYDKSTYHELKSCLANFSWRENLAYFNKNYNDKIDLNSIIIKNLQHFNRKYFENNYHQSTLEDIFYFLKGKLENLSHNFTLKTNIYGDQLNLLLKDNNFKVMIYYKNQIWGTMSIIDNKIIFDYQNMRVATKYKVTPSYTLSDQVVDDDWIKIKHILSYYFIDFFSKNDKVLELTHLINIIFSILVGSKDNIDDSFCITSTFTNNDRIADIIEKRKITESWIIVGVGFSNKKISPIFEQTLQEYLAQNTNLKRFNYKVFDERLWLKYINLKNCLENKGSWIFVRVEEKLKALDYHFSIKTKWENLYLAIKDMDFTVRVNLSGQQEFTLQLYIKYLGAEWNIYPEYNDDVKGIRIFEKINVS